MPIKVMLVDDEPHIRLILRKVIERNQAFEVVSECDNMTDALLKFNELQPEVVFMDIEIKGSSGIDCAKVISKVAPDTKIIFATAYSEYMSNAFEMYAFDYLVKPFDIERIEHTLERIQRTMAKNQPDNQIFEKEVQECFNQEQRDKTRILIKGKESVRFLDKEDIILIERENNTTVIYTSDGESYNTSMAMGELEEKLSGSIFMRSHKSYIINLSRIKSIEPYGRWTYIVKFKGTAKDALITKEHYEQVKQIYG